MSALTDIWREITTPSDASEGAYMRSLIAMGHVLVGGALAGVLPPLFVVLAYVVGKELAWDWWMRGGSLRDGLHDAGAVIFGVGLVAYFGPVVAVVFAVLLTYATISAVIYGVSDVSD